jgi:hypothetical protein
MLALTPSKRNRDGGHGQFDPRPRLVGISQGINPKAILKTYRMGIAKNVLIDDSSPKVGVQVLRSWPDDILPYLIGSTYKHAEFGFLFIVSVTSDKFLRSYHADGSALLDLIGRLRLRHGYFAPSGDAYVESMRIPHVFGINCHPLKSAVGLDEFNWSGVKSEPSALFTFNRIDLDLRGESSFFSTLGSFSGFPRLPTNYAARQSSYDNEPPFGPFEGCVPLWRVGVGFGLICLAAVLFVVAVRRNHGWLALFCVLLFAVGSLIWLTGHYWCDCHQQTEYRQPFTHSGNVSQKYVDGPPSLVERLGMSKGGYDKLLRKLEESNAENLRLQQEVVASRQTISELRTNVVIETEEPIQRIKGIKAKIGKFWASTPFWSGVTLLLGAIGSRVSTLLVYFAAWLLAVIEYIRIGFFKKLYLRIISVCVFGIVLVPVLAVIWKITPAQKESPTLDQQIDAVAKKFPWLVTGPKMEIPKAEIPQSPEHTHLSYLSIPEIEGAFLHQPPPAMLPESTLTIPVGFKNVGDFPVESTASSLACIPITTDDPNTAFPRVRKTFTFSAEGGTLQPHTDEISYQTVSCAVLTDEMIKQFFAKKLVFCGFGAVKWKDKSGRYETDFGQCLVAESDGKNWNWHRVPQTDQEKKLQ